MHPSFPQRFAAASLKPSGRHVSRTTSSGFSAAFCCGLIEAPRPPALRSRNGGFPQRFAAASLKRGVQYFLERILVRVFRSVLLRPH